MATGTNTAFSAFPSFSPQQFASLDLCQRMPGLSLSPHAIGADNAGLFVFTCVDCQAFVMLELTSNTWGIATKNTKSYIQNKTDHSITKNDLILELQTGRPRLNTSSDISYSFREEKMNAIVYFVNVPFFPLSDPNYILFKWVSVSDLLAVVSSGGNILYSRNDPKINLPLDTHIITLLQNDTFSSILSFIHLDVQQNMTSFNTVVRAAADLLRLKQGLVPANYSDEDNEGEEKNKQHEEKGEKEEEKKEENSEDDEIIFVDNANLQPTGFRLISAPQSTPTTLTNEKGKNPKMALKFTPAEIEFDQHKRRLFFTHNEEVPKVVKRWKKKLGKIRDLIQQTKKREAHKLKPKKPGNSVYELAGVTKKMTKIVHEQITILGNNYPFAQFTEVTAGCEVDESRTVITGKDTIVGARAWTISSDPKVVFAKINYFEFIVLECSEDSEAYVGWSTPFTDLLDHSPSPFFISLSNKETKNHADKVFSPGDVLGCRIRDGDKACYFSRNGKVFKSMPLSAQTIEYMLPHFFLRNCKIQVNFGATFFTCYDKASLDNSSSRKLLEMQREYISSQKKAKPWRAKPSNPFSLHNRKKKLH